MTSPNLLILGASGRAAAFSAVRAGLRPICADLFADDDLCAVAEILPVDHYPAGLTEAVRAAPESPWIYTGALENHPEILADISPQRPLWGNRAEIVAAVRNPRRMYDVLSQCDLPVPAVRDRSDPPAADGNWMLKPVRSAAGRGITVWDGGASSAQTLAEPHYFQQRILGTPISALFLTAVETTWLIGIARQLIGAKQLNAAPYAYCGSIAPIAVESRCRERIRRTGEVLAARFGLRGLFGIDFLMAEGTAWPTEINPRYTASAELFELAHGIALIDWHRRACASFEREGRPTHLVQELRSEVEGRLVNPPTMIVGKSILYAAKEMTAPAWDRFGPAAPGDGVPFVADRPHPDSIIRSGHPICTILASGRNETECDQRMGARVDDVKAAIEIYRNDAQ